jgi:hypothetical protein
MRTRMEITAKPGVIVISAGFIGNRNIFQKKNPVDRAHGVVNHSRLRLMVDHDKGAVVGSSEHSS